MARQEDRSYHVLIRWPAEDDRGGEPIGRLLAELGGVVVVPGIDRLVGFTTAADRDAAIRRAEQAGGDPGRAEGIGRGLVGLLERRGRPAELVVADEMAGAARALERALAGAAVPLVLVTTAVEPWADAHLDPLLTEVDRCDHALGR